MNSKFIACVGNYVLRRGGGGDHASSCAEQGVQLGLGCGYSLGRGCGLA